MLTQAEYELIRGVLQAQRAGAARTHADKLAEHQDRLRRIA